MSEKMIIEGGVVVTPDFEKAMDIMVCDGKIAAVREAGAFREDPARAEAKIVDASGKLVMPGLVEPHMHIKAPLGGIVDILDFDSASRCAAHGGVTTFMDFSSTLPGDSLVDAVEFRRKEMEISTLDYSLHCKVVNLADAEDIAEAMLADARYAKNKTDENRIAAEEANEKVNRSVEQKLQEIRTVVKEGGIPTFKLFMTYRKANVMIDDIFMLKVMKAVKEAGGRVGFHAESNAIAEYNEEVYAREGKLGWEYFAEYKGNLCEEEAVRRVLYYAEELGAPVYFFHLSTKGSVELIREAKKRGVDVIAETCCHYLTLTKEKNKGKDGILYLMSPPLRREEDRLALWEAVKDGTLSIVSSDNCTFPRAMKEAPLAGGDPDFRKPISGVSGVEERFGLLMRAVNQGVITLSDMVRVACENPARYFGCYPQKGCLEVGSDADIVIVDPNAEFSMEREALHYPEELEYSVYHGYNAMGRPVDTIRRGEFLVENGVYNESASRGRFLFRSL